jgi:hypothetical protein
VGEAARGDVDDRDVLDKPTSADAAEDAVYTEGVVTKRVSSLRKLSESGTHRPFGCIGLSARTSVLHIVIE